MESRGQALGTSIKYPPTPLGTEIADFEFRTKVIHNKKSESRALESFHAELMNQKSTFSTMKKSSLCFSLLLVLFFSRNQEAPFDYITGSNTRIGSRLGRVFAHIKFGTSGFGPLVLRVD